MTLHTLEDLFAYNLEELYYVETTLFETLDELVSDVEEEKLRNAFADHREETRSHIDRLETVFERLGQEPSKRESHVLEGLRSARREFLAETDDQQLRDLFDLQAGIKTERIEISGYEGMLVLADRLDYDDEITDPLEDNLSSEKSTLRELEGLSKGSKLKAMVDQLLS